MARLPPDEVDFESVRLAEFESRAAAAVLDATDVVAEPHAAATGLNATDEKDARANLSKRSVSSRLLATRLQGYSLAIVMPYIDAQLPRFFESIQTWSMHEPCEQQLPAQLLFYHPTNASESNLTTAQVRTAMGNRTAGCFGLGIDVLYADLPPEVAWKYPDGTCGQFYQLFELLRKRVDYFYLMEPDALPHPCLLAQSACGDCAASPVPRLLDQRQRVSLQQFIWRHARAA